MGRSVLGVGIPATASTVPEDRRAGLQKVLDLMESNMNASPYDWDMFYLTPDMPFDLWIQKLREKKWDIIMVGMGLRTAPPLTPFFEKIVNAAHEECPQAKFAFNDSIEHTEDACRRVLAP